MVNGKRTSVGLEGAMWDALVEIGRRERRTVHEICSEVARDRRESSLIASLAMGRSSSTRWVQPLTPPSSARARDCKAQPPRALAGASLIERRALRPLWAG